MPFVGQLEMFDPDVHLWSRYVKRLKHFLRATKVEDDLLVPTTFSLLGDKTFAIICDLFSPDDPDTKELDEILDKLTKHFSPRIMVPVERFHFSERRQKKDESIAEFVLGLRNLSKNCSYGKSLEERLCEQFVYGLFDPEMRTRLLLEEILPFDTAVKIASGIESAKLGAAVFKPQTNLDDVNRVTTQPRSTPSLDVPSQTHTFNNFNCNRCGSRSHDRYSCRFKDCICHKCGKVGHLAPVCQSSNQKNTNSNSIKSKGNGNRGKPRFGTLQSLEVSGNDDTVYDFKRISINNVTHSGNGPIMLDILVNKEIISFELDTGAGVTLIPENLFKQRFPECKLIPTRAIFRTITNQFRPLGKFFVSAEFKNLKCKDLEIYVIKHCTTPLLGRPWIAQLGILNNVFVKPVALIANKKSSSNLDNILKKYPALFSPQLGELKNFKAHLSIHKDSLPRFFKHRPIPFAMRSAVELELTKLQEQGVITPISHSDWAAPIVPILKKDNSLRICGDYKVGLNHALVTDSYPLPRIEDIFTQLNGGIIFSKLDMTQAYQQLCMDEESQLLLTINTHKGLFKVNRMPFGISTAPSIFQRVMDQVLAGLTGVSCYLDDILITGRSLEEHLTNLDQVLYKLYESGITLNKTKCEFLKSQVEYLGHLIDAKGLHASNSKISGITDAPPPQNVSQLRSFLGLVSYYRKFLPNLATVLTPLNKLLQKEYKWTWDSAAEEAFLKVKEAICSPKVLVYLDPKLPISLACDASPTGLGAVISHILPDGSDRPIAFASRSLSVTEKNYSQLDKEALGIIFGVKKFHQYLFGRKFLLLTDHKPLTRIFAPDAHIPTLAAARLQRWSLILSAYNYDIKYRCSTSNANADALSRSPSTSIKCCSLDEQPMDIFAIDHLDSFPVTAKEIASQTHKDALLSKVFIYTKNGWPSKCPTEELSLFFTKSSELNILNDCLLWGNRVIIPTKLQKAVLTELHKDHTGMVRMKMVARSYFWWPNVDKAIEEVSKSCTNCLEQSNLPPRATIHPWAWPSRPWERVHLDFAGPFMDHNFLIIVDAHSKWPEVVIMKSTTAEKTTFVLQNLVARYGIPIHLVTDNGTQFSSDHFKHFCKIYGIKHTFSAPYHPASNGQAERFVQTFKSMLKKKSKDNSTITEKVNQFLFSYRSTPNIATHQTPASLFLGREMRVRLDLIRPSTECRVRQYQERMVDSRKSNHETRSFEVGQKVLAKSYLGSNKWMPATIISQNGPLSYSVKLQNGKLWKRHIDQLREIPNDHGEDNSPLGTDQDSRGAELEPGSSNVHSDSKRNFPWNCSLFTDLTTQDCDKPNTSTDQPITNIPLRRNPIRNRKPPERLT